MKNFFKIMGIITLFIASFYYSDKVITVVREIDDVMIKINDNKDKYKVEPMDAIIINDEIIPGLNGRKVNISKSYRNMKRVNEFNSNLFEYETIKPKVSLVNNYQKYIVSGNKNKNMVSLMFDVKDDDYLDDVLYILNDKRIKASFFINSDYLNNNSNQAYKIVNSGNILGKKPLEDSEEDFTWSQMIIKSVTKQKHNYCYFLKKDSAKLNSCSLTRNYSVIPSIVVDKNPLKEVKDNLRPGSLISFKVNDVVLDELPTIISYIKSRGFKITNLDEHLSEESSYN